MNKEEKELSTLSVQVVGDSGVGKSAFIKCMAQGSFDKYNQHSLGIDFMAVELKIDNQEVVLQLWEENATSFHSLVIMYDVTSRPSYESAVQRIQQQQIKNPTIPIILVANKSDIEDERRVMEYEGEMCALQYQTLFNEVTCKQRNTVKNTIVELVKFML